MKTYKTTRTVGINGQHCQRGAVVQVSDKDAAYLLAVGDIVQVSHPEPENTSAPTGERETASLPTFKKAKKKARKS